MSHIKLAYHTSLKKAKNFLFDCVLYFCVSLINNFTCSLKARLCKVYCFENILKRPIYLYIKFADIYIMYIDCFQFLKYIV